MYLYKDYYKSSLNESHGFKPVYGGTGLGKTKGILSILEEENLKQERRKFIYLTNRHNLLTEFAEDLQEKGINYAYLKSDTEIISNLILNNEFRSVLDQLNDIGFFKFQTKHENILRQILRDVELIRQYQFILRQKKNWTSPHLWPKQNA